MIKVPEFPANDPKSMEAWFADFACRIPYAYGDDVVNSFLHCCGGKEIGGFSRIVHVFFEALRDHSESLRKDRRYLLDHFNNSLTRQAHKRIRKLVIKRGTEVQLKHLKTLSTIVATTTSYGDQELAASILPELGFKAMLEKRNSNSDNLVITWMYVGNGKLL